VKAAPPEEERVAPLTAAEFQQPPHFLSFESFGRPSRRPARVASKHLGLVDEGRLPVLLLSVQNGLLRPVGVDFHHRLILSIEETRLTLSNSSVTTNPTNGKIHIPPDQKW
jgi:hypothetical protein